MIHLKLIFGTEKLVLILPLYAFSHIYFLLENICFVFYSFIIWKVCILFLFIFMVNIDHFKTYLNLSVFNYQCHKWYIIFWGHLLVNYFHMYLFFSLLEYHLSSLFSWLFTYLIRYLKIFFYLLGSSSFMSN